MNKYRDVLHDVHAFGVPVPTPQGQPAYTLMQQTMAYNLAFGFPVITERSLKGSWRKAIGEICAFINGATTIQELEKFGCDWWRPWATIEKTTKRGLEPASLGPASYGGAFHSFPMAGSDGRGFDQFANLVEQIRSFPTVRTHFVSPWIPYWQVRGSEKSTIAPCHGWIHVRIIDKYLNLHMIQRSGDVPVGVPFNMVQYSALMLMLCHLTGATPGTYYHTISDAHIYQNQMNDVALMLHRGTRRLPDMYLNEDGKQVTDIHDFRSEHFELRNYNPYPGLRIPVSV